MTTENIDKATIQVNGEKFILVNSADKGESVIQEALRKEGFDEEHIIYRCGRNSATSVAFS